jgi:predicted DNA-binding transcriptional regulator YafY
LSRTTRLLDLLQLLRRHRLPVSGAAIARELGISLRTLYRDVATLQSQGAHIDGAPGLGYVLRSDFVLPPLMFTEDEVEALVLGTRWVVDRGDSRLAAAARDALAKIGAVLPAELRHEMDSSALLVVPNGAPVAGDRETAAIRLAIRRERKLRITYRDETRQLSTRTVWPFALGYFDRARVLVAWCEMRQDMRHFRIDRVEQLEERAERYPQRRQALLRQWREQMGISGRCSATEPPPGTEVRDTPREPVGEPA